MQWKAYGTSGLSQLVETLFDNAEYFKDQVAKTPGFRLLFSDLQSVNICFWYIPSSMRGEEENEEWWQKLSKVYLYDKTKNNSKIFIVGWSSEFLLFPISWCSWFWSPGVDLNSNQSVCIYMLKPIQRCFTPRSINLCFYLLTHSIFKLKVAKNNYLYK